MVLPHDSCVLLLLLSLDQVAKLRFVSWSQVFQWRGALGFPYLSQRFFVPSWIVREFVYSSLGFLCGVSCCKSLLCLLIFYESFLFSFNIISTVLRMLGLKLSSGTGPLILRKLCQISLAQP